MKEFSRRQFLKGFGSGTAMAYINPFDFSNSLDLLTPKSETKIAERSGRILKFDSLLPFNKYLRELDFKAGIDPYSSNRDKIITARDKATGDHTEKNVRLIFSESIWANISKEHGYADNPYFWVLAHQDVLNSMLNSANLADLKIRLQPTVILPDRELSHWDVEILQSEDNEIPNFWRVHDFGNGRLVQSPLDDLWWAFSSDGKSYPKTADFRSPVEFKDKPGTFLIDNGLLHEWIHALYDAPDLYHQYADTFDLKDFPQFPGIISGFADDIMSNMKILRISPVIAKHIRFLHGKYPKWRSVQSDGLSPKNPTLEFPQKSIISFRHPNGNKIRPLNSYFFTVKDEPITKFNPFYAGPRYSIDDEIILNDRAPAVGNPKSHIIDMNLALYQLGNINFPIPRTLLNTAAIAGQTEAKFEIQFDMDPKTDFTVWYPSNREKNTMYIKTFFPGNPLPKKDLLAHSLIPGTDITMAWTISI